MEFWKKWLHISLVFILTLSLLSPAAVQAESDEEGQLEAAEVSSERILLENVEDKIVSLKVGETFDVIATLQASNISGDMAKIWTSSDESIASVSQEGKITAISQGEAQITVVINEVSESITVQITEEVTNSEEVTVESITLNNIENGTISLKVGETFIAQTTINPDNVTEEVSLLWSSSNESVATVHEGTITAVAAGEAQITVAVDEVSIVFTVQVEAVSEPTAKEQFLQQLQNVSAFIWGKRGAYSLSAEQILALWQSDSSYRDALKSKVNASIQGETVTNYTKAVLSLGVTQSNPFSYNGVNYVEKLAASQIGEGYFSINNGSSDNKYNSFVPALFALEFVGAEYNREAALQYLQSQPILDAIKGETNGINLGLAVSALSNYADPQARAIQEELLTSYRDRGQYFAQGLGLYVDNLYAIGENPFDEKWNLQLSTGQALPVKEAYERLIKNPFTTSAAFNNKVNADGTIIGNESITSTYWSLVGLSALAYGHSMIQDAKQQFAAIDYDFSPKTIEATNISQSFLIEGAIFKPTFVVKDQYKTTRKASISLQSSNPAVVQVNEKNEIIAVAAGQAVVTASVDGDEQVKVILPFTVTKDKELVTLLPKIEKAIGHLTAQEKLSSFEDATALKAVGYDASKIHINLYGTGMNAYNDARNVLSLLAANQNPYSYNGKDYVALLNEKLEENATISSDNAATILLAQYVVGEPLSEKIIAVLLKDLKEQDGKMYDTEAMGPAVSRTATILQTVTLLNKEGLVKTPEFKEAEEKMFAFLKGNYQNETFAQDSERNAVAVLNYISLRGEQEGFNQFKLAEILLKNQYNNSHITNGMIPNLAGLQSESTGIALNALSYLLTNENAYIQLKNKNLPKPTTIALQVADKAKLNAPLELKGQLLDQFGAEIEATIHWQVNGEEVQGTFTPDTIGQYTIRAEANGIVSEKTIEVIDYQKVFSMTIQPLKDAVTNKAYELTAIVKDSEDNLVEDATISWGIEPAENVTTNGAVVSFNKVGSYTITAEAEGVKAKAIEVDVQLNSDSIQTQVELAVAKAKQYLESKGQYDYITALAYNNIVADAAISQKQLRVIGHLREYGKHDNKYSLYYAKNILQAVAAGEDPKQFKTYKGPIVDLITPLVNAQDEDGHFTMFVNFDKTSVATQAWSIIALDLINESYHVEAAVKDLLKGLNGAMSEGSYAEQEIRALSLIALSKHRDIAGVEQQIDSNLKYIRAQQNDVGGFNYGGYTNTPFAIGTIIQGLIAVGENPYDAKWKKNGKTMVEALLTQQIENGGFKFGDEFGPEYAFDEFKSTEAGIGALADLYNKKSMFNETATLENPLPELNAQVKPYIEIEELDLKSDQPLLSVKVNAFDNIDGELTPTVTLNDEPVYAVATTYKAIVRQGVNYLKVASKNSAGNVATETIPVLFQNEQAQKVPQATVKVAGANGASMYESKAIIEAGDTAYSILVKGIGKHNLVSRPYNEGVYIVGINGLAEFDYGKDSGWMYRVNGVFPDVFAGSIELKDGDTLEWLYTTDLGKDLGFDYPMDPNEKPSTGQISGGGSTANPEDPSQSKEDSPKESEDNKETDPTDKEKEVIEVEGTETQLKTELISEQIKQSPQGIVVKNNAGTSVTLPATLSTIPLAENEKISVNVEQNADRNRIDVKLEITSEVESRPLYTGKEYAKVIVPAPKATENIVVLQEVDGEYRAVPHKIVDGQIIILVKTSGSFIIKEEKVTFSDIENLANKDEIEFLASRHIIKGNGNGEFAPNEEITRGEFAAMISRALGLQVQGSSKFQDTKGKWYEQDVLALYEAGITKGKSETTFAPETQITREEAAAFMARILDYVNYQVKSGQLNYKDAGNIRAEFKEAIALLNQLDIMTGNGDGTFNAKGNTTRVQMAKILKRTLTISGLM